MDLSLLSASFLALALNLYVILDGFDLGVEILLLFQPAKASRDHMVDSITPTWVFPYINSYCFPRNSPNCSPISSGTRLKKESANRVTRQSRRQTRASTAPNLPGAPGFALRTCWIIHNINQEERWHLRTAAGN